MRWKELEEQEARRSGRPPELPAPIGESASAVLAAIFGDAGPNAEELFLTQVQARWSELAGPLAQFSKPVAITGDRLIVECPHPAYAQELRFGSAAILGAIGRLSSSAVRSLQVRQARAEK